MTGHRRGRKRGSGWEYLHVAIDEPRGSPTSKSWPVRPACAGFMTRAVTLVRRLRRAHPSVMAWIVSRRVV